MKLPAVIDERQLAGFRARALAPAALYEHVPQDESVLLINLPPGVGKSVAAQALVGHALERNHDLVIYVAPTRAIIDELTVIQQIPAGVAIVLEPRPQHLCGDLGAEWKSLEARGCAALAKATLCKGCSQYDQNGGSCTWPRQMDLIGPGTRLVVLTEQYLHLNPLLIPKIRQKVGAKRSLVIFDEALFLTSAVRRRFTRADLLRFRTALETACNDTDVAKAGIERWIENIDFLLDGEVPLDGLERFWPSRLRYGVLDVQRAGHNSFGSDFRYLAPDLELLNSPVTTGQWHDNETFEIAVRVDTVGSDVVIMAPYLEPEIVEERLARPVIRLFPNTVFRHSKTRVVNISDPVGAARSLQHPDHFGRVVDFFIALVLRNAKQGRRTVLVARKLFLVRIKERVEQTSAALGQPLACILPGKSKPFENCTPEEIPLINFGIVGVNSLETFDAIYCIGAYYARADQLNAVYQQASPPASRLPIAVRTEGRRRQTYAADAAFDTRFHAHRAAATHRMLERRIVLQAVGRVRPFTSPAEVILFQCDDLADELGAIEEFQTLAAARHAWKVPTSAQLRRAALGKQVRRRQQAGESLRSIAADLRIAPSTASVAAQSADLDRLLKEIGR